MSIWYQYDVVAFGDRHAIGKFFNLDGEKDIHYIDSFHFSFGQKNVPGLRLGKLIEQNPDLIFLVHQSTDFDDTWYLHWAPKANEESKYLFLHQNVYGQGDEFSKNILEEYKKKFPYLMTQHYEGRRYEWEMFVGSFENAASLLGKAEFYKDRVFSGTKDDFELDQAGNDFMDVQ